MKGVRSKYNVRIDAAGKDRRTYRSRLYASLGEMKVARSLDIEVKAGTIRTWFRQVPVDLGEDERWVIDFLVIPVSGLPYFIDWKGRDTADFRRKLKLYRKYGALPLHIIGARKNYWINKENG